LTHFFELSRCLHQTIKLFKLFKHGTRNIEHWTRNNITVICSMYRGGYLGVAWGFPGGFLGVSRGRPLLSPLQDSSNPQKTLSTHRTGWFFMPAFRTLFLNGMYHRACWNGIIILPIAISYFLDKKTNKMIKMNDPCRKRWGVCE